MPELISTLFLKTVARRRPISVSMVSFLFIIIDILDSFGKFILDADESRPLIPVVITGDGDFTRAILLLRSYSFPVLLVRPEHGLVNADFLSSTPHQIIWGSNSEVIRSWDKDVCIIAEAVKCLQAREKGYRYQKTTAVITEKVEDLLGMLWGAGRFPDDPVAWKEFAERSFAAAVWSYWYGPGWMPF